jgi:hypothetical protein
VITEGVATVEFLQKRSTKMSGLFSSPPPPPMPKPQPPAPMPDQNAPAVIEAKRRAQMEALRRGGRESTIITSPEDRGGSDYRRTTLGGK